ncbi:MAG TPA: serine/threonine-protein kinase [Gemmatimonadales bacterium]|nr:serine/threonine-protein kinase [Gemmatimonadales bacterium]
MTHLSDAALAHLRRVADRPEVPGDRYEVMEPIGQGGMGTVYRARDRHLEREVALKVLRPELADAASTRRLGREARILARLEHPGIVPVHEVGALADGRVYYVMKLIRGQSLEAFSRAASMSEMLRAFLRVCETVGFAHAHGVVHRDLKPSNIMIGGFGEVLVLDWGIARVVEEPEPAASGVSPIGLDSADTAPGTILGTPGFMAPEQLQGVSGLVDRRSDVFALGAILRAMAAVVRSPATPARPLAAIWGKALSPNPAERYPTAEAMGADVSRFLDAVPVMAYAEPLVERVRRLYHKYRAPLFLVLAYLLMRLLFLGFRRL